MATPPTMLNMESKYQTAPDSAYGIFPRDAGQNQLSVKTPPPDQILGHNTLSYDLLADLATKATSHAGQYIGWTQKTHDQDVTGMKRPAPSSFISWSVPFRGTSLSLFVANVVTMSCVTKIFPFQKTIWTASSPKQSSHPQGIVFWTTSRKTWNMKK